MSQDKQSSLQKLTNQAFNGQLPLERTRQHQSSSQVNRSQTESWINDFQGLDMLGQGMNAQQMDQRMQRLQLAPRLDQAHQFQEFEQIYSKHVQSTVASSEQWSSEFRNQNSKGKMPSLTENQWTHEFNQRINDEFTLEFQRLQSKDQLSNLNDEQTLKSQFQEIWNQFQESQWQNDQGVRNTSENEPDNFDELWKTFNENGNWANQFDSAFSNEFDTGVREITEYDFESQNEYMAHPDPLKLGNELMAQGNLSKAALAFEAAIQRSMGGESEVWTLLGRVQQENEKEIMAIAALKKGLQGP